MIFLLTEIYITSRYDIIHPEYKFGIENRLTQFDQNFSGGQSAVVIA